MGSGASWKLRKNATSLEPEFVRLLVQATRSGSCQMVLSMFIHSKMMLDLWIWLNSTLFLDTFVFNQGIPRRHQVSNCLCDLKRERTSRTESWPGHARPLVEAVGWLAPWAENDAFTRSVHESRVSYWASVSPDFMDFRLHIFDPLICSVCQGL